MKCSCHKLLFFFLIVQTLQLFAQENGPDKKWKLETGTGVNLFGPALKMADHMIANDFDGFFTYKVFSDKTVKCPDYPPVGITFQLSGSKYLSQRSQLGVLVNMSWLREVLGFHKYMYENIRISFTNFSLFTLYRFDLGKAWEIQAGLGLMINTGKRNDYDHTNMESSFRKLSPGVLGGISYKIWDKPVTFGCIRAQYILTTQNTMGPFIVSDWSGTQARIEEDKYGFSHMNIQFVIGIHL